MWPQMKAPTRVVFYECYGSGKDGPTNILQMTCKEYTLDTRIVKKFGQYCNYRALLCKIKLFGFMKRIEGTNCPKSCVVLNRGCGFFRTEVVLTDCRQNTPGGKVWQCIFS